MNQSQAMAPNGRLYTAAQVRELDRCAIDDHGIPGQDLMERAGKAAFDAICRAFPRCRRWLVVCGAGNNGGDGYVIARLAAEAGIDCTLHALKAAGDLKGDAAIAAQRWLETGGVNRPGAPRNLAERDLVVDALLGTGLDRPPAGQYADAVASINSAGLPVVAIDIPSGLNSDTGRAMGGLAVRAELTVSFIGLKRGLFTADGPDFAGAVEFADLGVPSDVYRSVRDSGVLVREEKIVKYLQPRRRNSHKGDFGWLLGIGGDRGMNGALRLAGESALRAGAGKVTLLTHSDHAAFLNLGCSELMVRGVESGEEIRELLRSADVAVVGTGLGQSKWSRSLLEACKGFDKPLVLDADALNLIAADRSMGDYQDPGRPTVITPHPAEAGRLLGSGSGEVQADRVAAAQELARICGAVAVLKGCGTVVADRDGRYAICPLGNPGMASAGTGDVLAGVIAAMLAQGLEAWPAAVVGVVAHAAAGDRAATDIGERGLIASDIISRLPRVLNPG